jgi:hypothetical protein
MTTTAFAVGDSEIQIATEDAEGDETLIRVMHTYYLVIEILGILNDHADEDGVVRGCPQPAVDTIEEAYLTGQELMDNLGDDGVPDDINELDDELLQEIRRTLVPVATAFGVELEIASADSAPQGFKRLVGGVI